MLSAILREVRPAATLLIALTLITGALYSVFVTAAAQVVFPVQANGSIIEENGKIIGSELIAQGFTSQRYFWPRPSACGYNAAASSGSNLAPSNPALIDGLKLRIADMQTSDPLNAVPVPLDLITTSGSGLDPHISVEAASWQVARVAKARGIPEAKVRALVDAASETATLGFLGEARVNVLRLNLELDKTASN